MKNYMTGDLSKNLHWWETATLCSKTTNYKKYEGITPKFLSVHNVHKIVTTSPKEISSAILLVFQVRENPSFS